MFSSIGISQEGRATTYYSENDSVINSIIDPNNGLGLKIYNPQFDEYSIVDQMTLTPILTPDNALEVYAAWLSKANTSINVEAQYIQKFDDSLPWDQDTSPIVRELVKAHQRGVTVRVIVNENSDSDNVTGYFESLGIGIRWMGANNSFEQRITQTHNKFVSIDGKVSILSSANFGPNAFYNNREAGMVIQHSGLTAYYDSVFELDWKMSAPDEPGEPGGSLGASIAEPPIQIGRDASSDLPKLDYSTNFVPQNFTGTFNATAFVSPDTVDAIVFRYLENAKQSIYVTMYTLSRFDFVDTLIALKQANPKLDIRVLVSHDRVGNTEDRDTVEAARRLTEALIPVRNTTKDFRFTHAKYWIIDGNTSFVYTGNWSPRSSPPQKDSYTSGEVNRDMGLAVISEEIATYFTTVFESDWAVGNPWPLPVGAELSLDNGQVISGIVNVQVLVNQLATLEYSIDSGEWQTLTITDGLSEFVLDTTQLSNGPHRIEVRGDYEGATYSDSATINVVNTNGEWRLLITEVVYDAKGSDTGKEYFEISNTFDFALYLEGWKAGDEKLDEFPSGFTIDPMTSIILSEDLAMFSSTYGVSGDLVSSISLTNTGDYVQLVGPKGKVWDAVAWGTATAPDGSTTFSGEAKDGKALTRSPIWQDTNDANKDFIVADPSPKAPITGVPPIGSTPAPTEPSTSAALPISFNVLALSIITIALVELRRRKKT